MEQAVFIPTDVFSIKGRGTVVAGSLQNGILAVGMKAKINDIETEVLGIEAFRKSIKSISSADKTAKNIGVLLKGVKKEDILSYLQLKRPIIFEGTVLINPTLNPQTTPVQN